MKGIFYTIINPLKFMTYNYLKGKFINYGFPEEAVHINLIAKEEMTIEVELYFKITEVGKKFYAKFNEKSFGIGNNYKFNIVEGKSSKKYEKQKSKEIKYNYNILKYI